MKKFILGTVLLLLLPLIGHSEDKKNIYEDKVRGFSVEVPAGWEVKPQRTGDLAVALVKSTPLKPFNPSIIISILGARLPMPTSKKELKQIVDQISGPSKNIPNIEKFKILKSALEHKVKRLAFYYQSSYELKRVSNPKEKKVKTLNFIFQDGNRFFAISLVSPFKEYKKYEKICFSVIDSLKLLDTTT